MIMDDIKLEDALREAVQDAFRKDDLENLTVKRMRHKVETNLELEDDFFRKDPKWRETSKQMIQAEVVGTEVASRSH